MFGRIFPRALAGCLLLGLLASDAAAQSETRPRQVSAVTQGEGATRLENEPASDEPFVVSLAPVDEASSALPERSRREFFHRMLLAAINVRIGTPYRLGADGPNSFDCSGFVWSVFQSSGVDFERTNARTLWSRFAPARGEERYQFGTLVFFNNLNHVGIVADEHGFYHASSSRGVIYSPFNEYWASRIDGFRRIQSPELATAGRLPSIKISAAR